MLKNETLLMVQLIKEACSFEDDPESPTKYFELHERDIKNIGLVLEGLGLAKKHKRAALGWKPTHRLLHIIAKKTARRSLQQRPEITTPADQFFLDSILGVAPAEGHFHLAAELLLALGLLRDGDDCYWKVTRQLRELFFEAYLQREEARREKMKKTSHVALSRSGN